MIIETQRLRIRFIREKDCDELTRHFQDKDVITPLETPPIPFRYSDAVLFYHKIVKTYEGERPEIFALADKENDTLIGCISLHPEHTFNTREDVAELGYWLGKKFWRQGYMYEACLPIIHHAFHKMKWIELVAQTNTDNKASKGLLKKLGFKFIAERTRPTGEKRGTPTDHCWALTKEQFLETLS